MSEREFDVVVVGAGSTGEVCAGRLAEGGLEVAIVERRLVGGECSYYACMPSKALLRPPEALAETKRVPGAAEAADGELDVAAALKRRDEVISNRDDSGQLPWLEERGIELVRESGRLDGERRVAAGDDVLVARRAVVLAIGTCPALPPIDGLAEAQPWTNRDATTSSRVPERLAVLGGGPVGAELAQAWGRLGSAVTLLEAEESLLGKMEPFASEQVADGLRSSGVDVRTGAKASRVGRNGAVTIELDNGDPVEADELLVATGRMPNTDGIGLEALGIGGADFLEVDDRMQVRGHEWLYAPGDVNGRALLTHMGKYQARICADHLLGKTASARDERPPQVVFTEPQAASVGHTLDSARDAGIDVRAVDVDTSGNAGGSFHGRGTAGTTRLVVDEERHVLVGATFVGAEIADFLHAATIAVVGEVPLDRLWHAVPSFPTRSEVWLKALEEYGL